MATFQKITPNLWFNTEAEEAVQFYTSVFRNSSTGNVSRYGEAGQEIHGMKPGTAMTVQFTLEGMNFLALNGGPHFKFTEAISFIIHCKDQEEIDYFWDKLLQGENAQEQACGWLKDQFGLSWQVVPQKMAEYMTNPDKAKAAKAMNALLTMKKLIISELEGN